MLQIPKTVYDALRSHGEGTYPHECCGFLLGSQTENGWQIADSIPATNAEQESPHNYYRINPKELVHISRQAHQRGLAIAGFYHSHPDHPAQWSQADLAEAHWLDCFYLVTAVHRGQATQTNAFLLAGATEEEKHFVTIPIQIEPLQVETEE